MDRSLAGPTVGVDVETGATALVRTLEQLAVEVAFGLPGVHNLPAWSALATSSIRLIGVRHEQAAVYAADGLARLTGKLGVALTTTGPGAANTLGATGEAWASHSPVLVIATDIPQAFRRPGVYRGVLHETRDQGAMFAPVVKDVVRITSADEIAPLVRYAAAVALQPSTGPVFVEIPTNLLSAELSPAADVQPPELAPLPVTGDADLSAAIELIHAAERPLIWAGGGAVRSGAGHAVESLAWQLGAPVIETFMGRALLPPSHPYRVGLPPHVPEVGRLWDDADLVIAIGTDFDAMMTQNWRMPQPPRLISVNVDHDDATKNYAADVALVGDARDTVERLVAGVRPRKHRGRQELAQLRTDVWAQLEADDADAMAFVDAIGSAITPQTAVFADMCIPGYWLAAFHPFALPRTLAYPVGWGTLGFAFPASLGAAAVSNDPVLCVSGDGGFLFACGELATVAQEQLPITVLLVDDGGYGMLRFDQQHASQTPFGVDLVRPDWVELVQSFGIRAERAGDDANALQRQLADHLADPRPTVLVAERSLRPPITTSPRWYRS